MQLNYKSIGSGPALIILHGLFGSLDNWQSLAKLFARHFSVFTIDLRNHGKSPHDDRFDYDAMADDLAEFMDQNGIPHAHLLGHSMGGKVAMNFAVWHEERLDKLIVADMAPVAYEPNHDLVLETLNSFPLERIHSRKKASDWMSARIPEDSLRQFLLKNLDRDKQKRLNWKFNLPVISQAYPNILGAIVSDYPIDKPVLFIRGEQSSYVKDEYFPIIRNMFPQAEFATITNAGHWLHADAPQAFLDRCLLFLLKQEQE